MTPWLGTDGTLILGESNLPVLCGECPCDEPEEKECIPIPSIQRADRTEDYADPHYCMPIARFGGIEVPFDLYATGYADDCLEVKTFGGETLYTDHDPGVNGVTHSYSSTLLCTVPANTGIIIYLWDTAYVSFIWSGSFCYVKHDVLPEEFE